MKKPLQILRKGAVVARVLAAGALVSLPMMGPGAAADNADVELQGGPLVMRRLTEEQYRNTIRDAFGDVSIGGRFEPDARDGWLIAVGAGKATVTPSAFEQYDSMATGIAQQVVSPERRREYLPCAPAAPSAQDDACVRAVVSRIGDILYRRPLTEAEIADKVKIAATGVTQTKDFYYGLQLALTRLLTSPEFLFVQEQAVPDPSHPGGYKLAPQSMATRLSLLLWGSSPDPLLLAAAKKGELDTPEGLAKQVDRMLASPRLERGARAYFADMLMFDKFAALSKDAALYPNYSSDIAKQGQEQTLRTIVDELVTRNGDYRTIFTTNRTFLTPALASAYGVPLQTKWGDFQDWQPVTLPANMSQAGILTEIGFAALHSSSGKTSPTLRGKAVREVILCQEMPPPPPDVDFTKFVNTNAKITSVREAITAHASNPACAGCHKLMDPLGLALENYDTSGHYRQLDASKPIDASGNLDNVAYQDAATFGKAVAENPRTTSCLVNRVYTYAAGRNATANERTWVRTQLLKDWAADGYKYPALLRRIATNPGFYRVVMPQKPPAQTASPSTPATESKS